MKHPIVLRLLAGLLIATLATAPVLAQKASDTESLYPNATRTEPRVSATEREQRELNRAIRLSQDDRADEAFAAAQKIIDNRRSGDYAKAFAYQLQGYALYEKDEDEGAVEKFEKALELNTLPNDTHYTLLYQIAQIQMMAGEDAEALATLDRWEKESGGTNPDSWALRGNLEYRLDRYPEAISSMKRAIDTVEGEPRDSWMQVLMASYAELDQYDEAIALLQAQRADDPTSKRLLDQLITLYIRDDRNEAALQELSRAKDQGMFDSAADYDRLAKLYAMADQPKQAVAAIREGLDKGLLEPSYDVWKLLGDVCTQAEDDSCAIDAYSKAAPLAPDGNIDYQLGYVLFYSDNAEQAVAALTRAIEKGQLRQEGEAYLLRGDAYNDMDHGSQAMADWRKAQGYASTKTMAEQRINNASRGR